MEIHFYITTQMPDTEYITNDSLTIRIYIGWSYYCKHKEVK